jgi:hypothetical protein
MLPSRRTIVEKNFLRRRRAFDFSHSLGQKRKCPGSRGTSVLPSGADIVSLPRHVRFVPQADYSGIGVVGGGRGFLFGTSNNLE